MSLCKGSTNSFNGVLVGIATRLRRFAKFFDALTKFFEVFVNFFEVFATFSRFSDPFGSIRTCWDAFRCIGTHLEASGRFQKKSEFFDLLRWFSMVSDVVLQKSRCEQVRAGPSKSENFQNLAKTSGKLAKTSRKSLKKIFVKPLI